MNRVKGRGKQKDEELAADDKLRSLSDALRTRNRDTRQRPAADKSPPLDASIPARPQLLTGNCIGPDTLVLATHAATCRLIRLTGSASLQRRTFAASTYIRDTRMAVFVDVACQTTRRMTERRNCNELLLLRWNALGPVAKAIG